MASPEMRRRLYLRSVGRRRLVALRSVALLCGVGLSLVALSTNRHVALVGVSTARANGLTPDPSPTIANSAAVTPFAPHAEGAGGVVAPSGAGGGGAAPPATTRSVMSSGASASFVRLSRILPGRVELAIAPLGSGSTQVLGADIPAHGWSTTKVPVLVALLKARGRAGLTATENAVARSAITESNNESILALFGALEHIEGGLHGASAYIQGLFRASGDDETVVTTAPPPVGAVTTFGQTEWRPSEAVKFFRALGRGCLVPPEESRYVLNLMSNIEPSESWGLGSAGFGSVAFKGGWGPEPSGAYLVRQSGIVDPGSSRGVAVSIVAFPRSGSFSTGTQMLTQTSVWLRHELRLVPRSVAPCTAT